MKSSNDISQTQKNRSHWRVMLVWLTDWVNVLDYNAYEHTSKTINEFAGSILTVDKRLVALERFGQKNYKC